MGFVINPHGRWDNGVIPYRFLTMSQDNRQLIRKVMDRWEEVLQDHAGRKIIEFRPVDRTFKGARIKISRVNTGTSAGCKGTWSSDKKGLVIGGEKLCSLGDDIENWPHELGHVIGLGHEHMRPDSLLQPRGNKGHGLMRKERQDCFSYGAYDYQSIMHYTGQTADFQSIYNVPAVWAQHPIQDKRSKAEIESESWNPSNGDLRAIVYMYGAARPGES